MAGGGSGAARLRRLGDAIRLVLDAAILAGGSSLRDYARPDGELGYFRKEWRVYGREGEPCACGAPVGRGTGGGRSDRESGGWGKGVVVRVYIWGRRRM